MLLKRIYKKLKFLFTSKEKAYDFNKSNPLGGNGERVDINLSERVNFNALDIYQKNHFKRYEFAREIITPGDVCGDFACGTGYGTVMISRKAKLIIGADLNDKVITAITERYKKDSNVIFLNENLLDLSYYNYFDCIICFETLEHFEETNVIKVLTIFRNALKKNGKIIFSTPFMQEKSEEAIKMGFHLTFYISEQKIEEWLKKSGFKIDMIKYQNYDSHDIKDDLKNKEFIICVAQKEDN